MSGADKYFDQGDLIVSPRLREIFPFCVECKHRKIFRLENVFSKTKEFLGYHEQVLEACGREGNSRTPMVVVRGRGGSIYASVPALTVAAKQYRLPETSTVVSYRTEYLRWILTDLDSFLNAIFASKGRMEGQSSNT